MKWYHHIAALVAGFCFANAVPHGVAGMMGETFPSPFADPPGLGHSSAFVNALWSLTNIFVGYVFLRLGKVNPEKKVSMFALFLGVATATITLSLWFGGAATPQ